MTKTVERKPITQAMQLELWKRHGLVKCGACQTLTVAPTGNWMHDTMAFQWDHHLALVDGGKHEVGNLRPICTVCHAKKSAVEHKNNSKAKRIAKKRAGLTKPKAKIAGRGFDKTKTKGFDGKVRARNG